MEPLTVKDSNYRQPPTKRSISIFAENSTGYNKLRDRIPEVVINQIATTCIHWAEENEKTIKNSEVVFQFQGKEEKKQ